MILVVKKLLFLLHTALAVTQIFESGSNEHGKYVLIIINLMWKLTKLETNSINCATLNLYWINVLKFR